jgi:hypothetical protein
MGTVKASLALSFLHDAVSARSLEWKSLAPREVAPTNLLFTIYSSLDASSFTYDADMSNPWSLPAFHVN